MARLKTSVKAVFALAFSVHLGAGIWTVFTVSEGPLGHYTRSAGLFLFLLWLVVAAWSAVLWARDERHDPLLGAMLLGTSILIAALRLPWPWFGSITYFATISFLAMTASAAFSVAAITISAVVAAALLAAIGTVESAVHIVVLALGVVPVSVMGRRLLARLREQSEQFDQAWWAASELSAVLMRVEDSIKRAKAASARSERIRVAREVHDTVGYSLTAVAVQLRVAREMAETPDLKNRLEQLEQLVRLTLKDIREQVTALRHRSDDERPITWTTRWRRMCKSFTDSTGIRVNAEIQPELAAVDDPIGEVIYRILQETLTNAYRHGRATYVHVQLTWRGDLGQLLLHVSDNGIGCTKPTLGNGLRGIEERVSALRGSVEWDTLPGKGFDIGIDIPWKVRS